ncbi:hypothetical protein BSKO_12460 [Bryopsis sp. KO-2023]|nr:hypothetical protein BSKO_12460 [Bryopsis sp. KO-2023]
MRLLDTLAIVSLCCLFLHTQIAQAQGLSRSRARTRVGQLFQGTLRELRDNFSGGGEPNDDTAETYYRIEGQEGMYSEVPPPDETMFESESELEMARLYTRQTNGFIRGVAQFGGLRPVCSRGAIGILVGCLPQFLPVTVDLGFPLTHPRATPEKFTPELLAKIPEPDSSGLCCWSAIEFQESMCACDPETITAMKNMGIFDPEMTVPLADYVYGEQCGATTFLAEECPNGSPFEILRQG